MCDKNTVIQSLTDRLNQGGLRFNMRYEEPATNQHVIYFHGPDQHVAAGFVRFVLEESLEVSAQLTTYYDALALRWCYQADSTDHEHFEESA